MDTRIFAELEECFSQELSLAGNDLGTLESAVTNFVHQLGQGLQQRLVERQPNGYKGSSIVCGCGSSLRFVGHRGRNVHTVGGWIKVKRAYYHGSQCGRSLVPYDHDSGIGSESLSAGLA